MYFKTVPCQVWDTVPEPYMDEVFHIPQARAYCAGNYSQWDPKITTLPGLYLFSVGILRPLHLLSPSQFQSLISQSLLSTCTVPALRAVNILAAITNLVLLHCLTRYTALYCAALNCTALHCTALHCTEGPEKYSCVTELVFSTVEGVFSTAEY